jgi:hydroxypyruvate reductase
MDSAPTLDDPRALLRQMFDAAVRAAAPATCVPPYLPAPTSGRTIVLGAGKAAAAMARAVEDAWSGPLEGLVVTRYGHAVPCAHIEVVEASHPVPDAAGLAAAKRILQLAESAGEGDLVLCLISGGASALLTAPAAGLTLAQKQEVNRQLLASGASISEMNCVRKHLSGIKGGRLALAAAPARVVSLLISDVPGDDPATIGSGPTVVDPTTRREAADIIARYSLDVADEVRSFLDLDAAETPKPGDLRFEAVQTSLVAAPSLSLDAAAAMARDRGMNVISLGDAVEGESRDVACAHAQLAIDIASGQIDERRPALILSGGETTVTISGSGRGGPNAEYALALAIALDGHPGIHAIACDTDGIDGSEDNAGAVIGPDTLVRAAAVGVDAKSHLGNNDAYGFFEVTGDLVMSGPTLTNVNDFRAILVV